MSTLTHLCKKDFTYARPWIFGTWFALVAGTFLPALMGVEPTAADHLLLFLEKGLYFAAVAAGAVLVSVLTRRVGPMAMLSIIIVVFLGWLEGEPDKDGIRGPLRGQPASIQGIGTFQFDRSVIVAEMPASRTCKLFSKVPGFMSSPSSMAEPSPCPTRFQKCCWRRSGDPSLVHVNGLGSRHEGEI